MTDKTTDDEDEAPWNRECVICGIQWLGTDTDDCPRKQWHADERGTLVWDRGRYVRR